MPIRLQRENLDNEGKHRSQRVAGADFGAGFTDRNIVNGLSPMRSPPYKYFHFIKIRHPCRRTNAIAKRIEWNRQKSEMKSHVK